MAGWRWGRIALGLALAAVLAPLALLGWLLLVTLPEPDAAARKGSLVSAEVTAVEWLPDSRVELVRLSSDSGLSVELALRLPERPLPSRPLVLLMAGQETGREAVRVIPEPRGVAVAAISYPFGVVPHRDGLDLVLALGRIQAGILDTAPSVLLALDYLLSRPDLRPGRLELAGVSFGAYLAAVPAVLDDRVDRLWLIHGSGDPATVLSAALHKAIPAAWLRDMSGQLLAAVAGAHHLSPEYWVHRLPPRPLVVVNAREDSAIPPAAVEVLHRSLEPPYEVLWTPGDHVHPKRPETVKLITDMIFERVSAEATVL